MKIQGLYMKLYELINFSLKINSNCIINFLGLILIYLIFLIFSDRLVNGKYIKNYTALIIPYNFT